MAFSYGLNRAERAEHYKTTRAFIFVLADRGSRGGNRRGGKGGGAGGERQPDPMQTSVGYIGADAFHKQMSGGGGGGRGRRRR